MKKKKKTMTTKKKQKKFKGFTLIELLAVIIILGVLMIIAIPSVTEYIQSSRKNAYVTTAGQLVSGARNKINAAEIPMYDIEATYYVPTSCINLEKGGGSPFGEIEEGYIVVTYDGFGYDYYFTVRDSAGMGILLTSENLLENKKVSTGVTSLDTTIAIEGKEKILVVEDCKSQTIEKEATATIPAKGSYEQKQEQTMTTPYFERVYQCYDLRNGKKEEDLHFYFYEDGNAVNFNNAGATSSIQFRYENNKLINANDNKAMASISIDGKTLDFKDGDYGLDNAWWTCILEEETSKIKYNKPYTGVLTEDGVETNAQFTFYKDGSALLESSNGENVNLAAKTFVYTKDKVLCTNGFVEHMDILDSGNKIKIYDIEFTLKN